MLHNNDAIVPLADNTVPTEGKNRPRFFSRARRLLRADLPIPLELAPRGSEKGSDQKGVESRSGAVV